MPPPPPVEEVPKPEFNQVEATIGGEDEAKLGGEAQVELGGGDLGSTDAPADGENQADTAAARSTITTEDEGAGSQTKDIAARMPGAGDGTMSPDAEGSGPTVVDATTKVRGQPLMVVEVLAPATGLVVAAVIPTRPHRMGGCPDSLKRQVAELAAVSLPSNCLCIWLSFLF